MAPILTLFTDDPRLQRKAEHYSSEYGTEIVICSADVEARIDALRGNSTIETLWYFFLDLDAKEFDAYALASLIRSAFPAAVCIAFALSPDPSLVQKTKLSGIPNLLQRFAFEELLKKICIETGTPTPATK